jgi:hypothetical protein
MPGIALPGAFAPTVARLPGALLEFHPTVRAAEQYSDNFFETTSGAQEDFRSVLGPGFVLLLNGAHTFGAAAGTVDLVHDTAPNSGDEVKAFPSFNAAFRYALTPRLALTLSDTFVRSDEPGFADQFGLRRGRQIFDTNTMTAAVDWILDRFATQAYYRNVLFTNEGSQQNLTATATGTATGTSDTDANILGVNGSTRFATDYIARLGYEFSRITAINGTSTASDNTTNTGFGSVARQIGLYGSAGLSSSYSVQSQQNTKIWNGSVFGAYGLPTGLSLYGAVGYSLLNSDTSSNNGTVFANATASYRFTRAFISVGVLQDFQQTAQQGQNFGTVETRSYFGSFLYQWTPFINTTLHATYAENQGTGTGNLQNNGTQKTLTYGASLNWQLLRWLTATLQYTYTKQTGTNAFIQGNTGDFAENRATIAFFATF